MNIGPLIGLLLAGSPCDDAAPAKGGFFAGISGLSGGCYEERIETREQAVEEREQTRDALEAERRDVEAQTAAAATELGRLQREHMDLKRRIVKLNSDLAARRVTLDGATRSSMQAVLTSKPAGDAPGQADAERIDSLRAAIEDARSLVDKLSSL